MNNIIHRLARTNESDALEEAIRAGADVNEKDEFGATPLHYSISEANPDVTRCLLDLGADATVQDGRGATPLHYAAEYGASDVAELLLETNRAVVDVSDQYGNQPLWTAVFNANGRYVIVAALLRYGADATHKNHSGVSPLGLAKQMNDTTLTSMLENPGK